MNEISILTLRGAELEPWLEHVAGLRIRVFRDFPYLYDGTLEYEANYLRTYVETDTAVCVLALDGDRVVGASTGLALSAETAEFRRPFEQAGIDTAAIFYCAESVLLPEYRGSGVYSSFFRERESHASGLGMRSCVFCAVQRPEDHPLRPADYQSLDPVWRHFGYSPRPDLVTRFNWKDIDQAEASDKPMQFYLKSL
ncbi:GNAT family acetyltransferase [Marinobacterium zhoushanense]|uniref:GNAT family acetyltransferase n=1 Tax=Marinobacterium zhoushanense TaxID=1679163 RepID=A0ABQ1KPB1_9GAMM|nr:GNAT family N-acetyltransferase [Marinobacterium zhoushanense]GGC06489.1 GNAT family acetyltransferase [Marinobacterium zhoushanense]